MKGQKQSFFRRITYGDATLSGTEGGLTIFTAEENCTLRRIISQVSNRSSTYDSMCVYQFRINPSGVDVGPDLQSVNQIDAEMPMEYLHGGIARSGTQVNLIDNKGMRKLRKGDTIAIYYTRS